MLFSSEDSYDPDCIHKQATSSSKNLMSNTSSKPSKSRLKHSQVAATSNLIKSTSTSKTKPKKYYILEEHVPEPIALPPPDPIFDYSEDYPSIPGSSKPNPNIKNYHVKKFNKKSCWYDNLHPEYKMQGGYHYKLHQITPKYQPADYCAFHEQPGLKNLAKLTLTKLQMKRNSVAKEKVLNKDLLKSFLNRISNYAFQNQKLSHNKNHHQMMANLLLNTIEIHESINFSTASGDIPRFTSYDVLNKEKIEREKQMISATNEKLLKQLSHNKGKQKQSNIETISVLSNSVEEQPKFNLSPDGSVNGDHLPKGHILSDQESESGEVQPRPLIGMSDAECQVNVSKNDKGSDVIPEIEYQYREEIREEVRKGMAPEIEKMKIREAELMMQTENLKFEVQTLQRERETAENSRETEQHQPISVLDPSHGNQDFSPSSPVSEEKPPQVATESHAGLTTWRDQLPESNSESFNPKIDSPKSPGHVSPRKDIISSVPPAIQQNDKQISKPTTKSPEIIDLDDYESPQSPDQPSSSSTKKRKLSSSATRTSKTGLNQLGGRPPWLNDDSSDTEEKCKVSNLTDRFSVSRLNSSQRNTSNYHESDGIDRHSQKFTNANLKIYQIAREHLDPENIAYIDNSTRCTLLAPEVPNTRRAIRNITKKHKEIELKQNRFKELEKLGEEEKKKYSLPAIDGYNEKGFNTKPDLVLALDKNKKSKSRKRSN